ncbi:MAG TPA: hypothetical protein VG839_02865 [Asticcacaulis sp.]|nr:hypothetical protein [Asticcacaulis sp.]
MTLSLTLMAGAPCARAEAPAVASSASPPSEDICAHTACRKGGFNIAVLWEDGNYVGVPVPHSPYVLDDGSIIIYPGETLAFQFSVDGDTLSPPKFVQRFAPRHAAQVYVDGKLSANPDDAQLPPRPDVTELPPNTILISYDNLDDMKKGMGTGTSLEVGSTLPKMLKFDATLNMLKTVGTGYDPKHRDTCAVQAHSYGAIAWSNPNASIVIRHFHFTTDLMTCS